MDTFTPTALLVKEHTVTGLKYFCKSTRLDKLEKYTGSGTYWIRHLKTHGKTFTTGVVGVYYERERCVNVALEFSKTNNIVESSEWANLQEENGIDGIPCGTPNPGKGKKYNNPIRSAKISAAMKGNKNGLGNRGNPTGSLTTRFAKGRTPWNKGLTKATDSRVKNPYEGKNNAN